jgi:wobble nucleotide-excising tRNase
MPEIQFEVTTDLTPVANTEIQTNFEAVKAWLTQELSPYATMVVTSDKISDAKKTRAQIRKVGDSIDAQRKAVKSEWMKPYTDYEAKCKELIGIVNDAVSNIDGQIKEYENSEKEAKRQRLWTLFTDSSSDIKEYVQFEDLFDKKWLNATFAETDAANIIVQQLEDIRAGLSAIRSLQSPYETAMLGEYARSRNLSKALAEGKRLEAIAKAEEERKAREVTVMQWKEPESTDNAETTVDDYEGAEVEIPKKPFRWPSAVPKTYGYQFIMPSMTVEQMKALKACLDENGIEYKATKLQGGTT